MAKPSRLPAASAPPANDTRALDKARQLEDDSRGLARRTHRTAAAGAWLEEASQLAERERITTTEAARSLAAAGVPEHAETLRAPLAEEALPAGAKSLCSASRIRTKDASSDTIRRTLEEVSLRHEECESRLSQLSAECDNLESDLRSHWPSSASENNLRMNAEANTDPESAAERLIRRYPTATKHVAEDVRQALLQFYTHARSKRTELVAASNGVQPKLSLNREDRLSLMEACENANSAVGVQGIKAIVKRIAPRFPALSENEVERGVHMYFDEKRARLRRRALAGSLAIKHKELLNECERRLKESEQASEWKVRRMTSQARRSLRQTQTQDSRSNRSSSSSNDLLPSGRTTPDTEGMDTPAVDNQIEQRERAEALAAHYIRKAEEEANERVRCAKDAVLRRSESIRRAEEVAEREERRKKECERKEAEDAELEELREQERQGFVAHLERIKQQVQIHAERDPERMHASTQSHLQKQVQPSNAAIDASEPIGRGWEQHGFSEDQLKNDQRFRLQQTLVEAKLNGTQAAQEALASTKPIKPQRADQVSTLARLG